MFVGSNLVLQWVLGSGKVVQGGTKLSPGRVLLGVLHGLPSLGRSLSTLYENFFYCHNVPSSLKFCVILPLFKSKGAKASNKDSYMSYRITPFPTIYKI